MRKLIDYSTKIPKEDNKTIGHLFPYNSCELLICDNPSLSEAFFEERKFLLEDDDNSEESKEKEEDNENSKEDNKKEKQYEIRYDNIDYLLKFLNSKESNDNHVLIGYFNKIVQNLIYKNQYKTIKYLLTHGNYQNLLIQHLQLNEFSFLFQEILKYEPLYDKDNKLTEDEINNFNKCKTDFVFKILIKLNNADNPDITHNIADILCQSFNYKNSNVTEYTSMHTFLIFFISNNNLMELLYSILYKHITNSENFRNILCIFININKNILDLITDKVLESKEDNIYYTPTDLYLNNISLKVLFNSKDNNLNNENDNYKSTLKFIFDNLIENEFIFLNNINEFNDKDNFNNTLSKSQKRFGLTKLNQLDYLLSIIILIINANYKNYYIDEINKMIDILESKNIFNTLFNLFNEFELNNMLHLLYMNIVKAIFHCNSPSRLIQVYIGNQVDSLIRKHINSILENKTLEFYTDNRIIYPQFPFEINILRNINIYEKKELFKEQDSKDLLYFYKTFINLLYNKYMENKLLYEDDLIYNENIDSFNQSNKSNSEEVIESIYNNSLNEEIKQEIDLYKLYLNGDIDNLENKIADILKKMEILKNNNKRKKTTSEISNDISSPINKMNIKSALHPGDFPIEDEEMKDESKKQDNQENNVNKINDNFTYINNWNTDSSNNASSFDKDLDKELGINNK